MATNPLADGGREHERLGEAEPASPAQTAAAPSAPLAASTAPSAIQAGPKPVTEIEEALPAATPGSGTPRPTAATASAAGAPSTAAAHKHAKLVLPLFESSPSVSGAARPEQRPSEAGVQPAASATATALPAALEAVTEPAKEALADSIKHALLKELPKVASAAAKEAAGAYHDAGSEATSAIKLLSSLRQKNGNVITVTLDQIALLLFFGVVAFNVLLMLLFARKLSAFRFVYSLLWGLAAGLGLSYLHCLNRKRKTEMNEVVGVWFFGRKGADCHACTHYCPSEHLLTCSSIALRPQLGTTLGLKGILLALGDLPGSVSFAEHEKLEWLNAIVAEVWPFFDTAVCKMIKARSGPPCSPPAASCAQELRQR
jgi:hypothetical protein